MSTWKNRYFVLTDEALAYYKEEVVVRLQRFKMKSMKPGRSPRPLRVDWPNLFVSCLNRRTQQQQMQGNWPAPLAWWAQKFTQLCGPRRGMFGWMITTEAGVKYPLRCFGFKVCARQLAALTLQLQQDQPVLH